MYLSICIQLLIILFGIQKDLGGICSQLSVSDPLDFPKTIIFVQTKTIACKVFSLLKAASVSVPDRVDMYHASNTEGTKVQVHRDFSGQTQLRCLVSTIAFGMVREVARSLAAYNNITIL